MSNLLTKKIIIYILLLQCFINVQSQNQKQNNQDYVLPSPNAAALGMYGDIPISYYNGIPSISIPLYTVNLHKYSLPISANYHASGIRVDQEASWIGLGWSLDAGGVITRTIRGEDDLKNNGTTPDIAPETHIGSLFIEPITHEDYSNYFSRYCIDSQSGSVGYLLKGTPTYDTEQDFFTFNFAGYSGKFILKNGGANVITGQSMLLDPTSNIKIYYEVLNKDFFAVTPDGTKYYFRAKETTIPCSSEERKIATNTSPQINSNINIPTPEWKYEYTSSWYLTQIVTTTGEVINFDYVEEPRAYMSITNISEFRINNVTKKPAYIANEDRTTFNPSTIFNLSRSIVTTQRLSKISWEQGHIIFDNSVRDDLQYYQAASWTPTIPQKLEAIKIYNCKENNPIKQYKFSYDYINNAYVNSSDKNLYLRLILTSIQEMNGDRTMNTPPYSFTYNSGNLPSKGSPSTDLWGFYNGKSNYDGYRNLFIPTIYNPASLEKVDGADKTPSAEHMIMGTLESIKYPTGGTTTFTFEPNSVETSSFSSADFLLNSFKTEEMTGRVDNSDGTIKTANYTINLTSSALVTITANCYRMSSLLPYPNSDYIFGTLTPFDAGFYWEVPAGQTPSYVTKKQTYKLSAGSYTMTLSPRKWDRAEVYIKIETATNLKQDIIAGGIRVAKIENSEGKIKHFYYKKDDDESSCSSGILLNDLIYNVDKLEQHKYSAPPYEPYAIILLKGYNSSSYAPLSTRGTGNLVGYSRVVEKEFDNNGNSYKTEYLYENNPHRAYRFSRADLVFDYKVESVPSDLYEKGTGNLLRKKYFANDKILNEIINSYDNTAVDNNKSICYSYFEPWIYENHSYFNRINQTESIDYFYDGEVKNSITKQTKYEYNDKNFKPKTTTTYSSNGDSIKLYITYGCDMASSNVGIEMPIEQIETINDKISKGNLYIYNGTSLKQKYTLGIQTPISYDTFQKYDGEIVNSLYGAQDFDINYNYMNMHYPYLIKKSDQTSTIYLWGHIIKDSHNTFYPYPIAEIKNATYSEVESAATSLFLINDLENLLIFDSSNEEKLRNGSLQRALPNAIVTTYTYKPLVGIETKTDSRGVTTYYSYDDFNRLQYIKDKDGKILQSFDYNYKH